MTNLTINHTKNYYEICKGLPRHYRYYIGEGGTRSGKTWSLSEVFINFCLQNPYKKEINQIFRKELTRCRKTVMRDFLEVAESYNLFNLNLINVKAADSLINIAGNYVEFCGADQAQKLRGSKRTRLWMNETNEFTEEDFLQLKTRTDAEIFFDYNPSFTNSWIYDMIEIESGLSTKRIIEIANNKNGVCRTPRLKFIQSTYKDNPMLSKEIIYDIENLKKYNENDYQIYALGIRSNPSGFIFKRVYYSEYQTAPPHYIGCIYVDPNLAKKGKGDTTAMIKLLYSPETNLFYVDDLVCRSFDDSNDLLKTVISLMDEKTIYIAFDGNYSQGSTWQQHVENYARINNKPFPLIHYKHYNVDELSKNAQYIWNDRQIKFKDNIKYSQDGEKALNQIYMFNGKKNTPSGQHDDAPDALICSIQFMYDLNFVVDSSTKDLLKLFYKK